MAAEILEYFYTTDWNIECLKDLRLQWNLSADFPLVVSSMSSYRSDSLTKTYEGYSNNVRRINPKIILDSWNGGFNRRISEYLGINEISMLVTANCSSSIYCLYLADLISQDKQRPVVVVCADNVNHNFDLWRFDKLGAIDNSTGDPFDLASKGFRMGTGIAVFLVKHINVRYYGSVKAVINNTAFWTNNSLTHPGTSDDIIKNLQGIDYNVFDFWNAHAPGTPLGDRTEYEYFNKVIKKDIPIVSYKNYVGHCMTASGAVEIAMALEDKKNNVLRPNKIKTEKIVNDDRIITDPTKFDYQRMFKSTLGFGGKIAVADISLF